MPTITMTEEEIKRFCLEYQAFEELPTNEYMSHFFRTKGASVSIYKSGKVVFQGSNLEMFSAYLHVDTTEYPYDFFNTIGADEVGTGDTFGPIVCAACLVEAKDTDNLRKRGVKDSKKISDKDIKILGEYLINNFKHKVNIVRNETFNDKQSEYNLNEMKALLHNQNISNLAKENKYDFVCLDEFVNKDSYFSYIKNNPFRDIHFEMKGETKSIAVASASIIARYFFLIEMDRLKKEYGYDLPKGSGTPVQDMITRIRNDGKEDIFYHIGKLSYKSFNK